MKRELSKASDSPLIIKPLSPISWASVILLVVFTQCLRTGLYAVARSRGLKSYYMIYMLAVRCGWQSRQAAFQVCARRALLEATSRVSRARVVSSEHAAHQEFVPAGRAAHRVVEKSAHPIFCANRQLPRLTLLSFA